MSRPPVPSPSPAPAPASPSQPSAVAAGSLQLVATPIGHLADFSVRGVTTLREAAAVACEDTRHTIRLLQHYELHVPLLSLNEHNEARRIPELLQRIQQGENIALVSDAGFPTVSDPGQRLVHAAIAAGVKVEVIPGASAVLTALAGSGLPTVPFYFGGFLPHKKGQRDKELEIALARECTSIYFESPYRLVDTLEMISLRRPQHPVVVARELTKLYEDFRRGSAQTLLDWYQHNPPKGEITLLLAPMELPKWMTRGDSASDPNL